MTEMDLPGAAALIELYGYLPTFHDARILCARFGPCELALTFHYLDIPESQRVAQGPNYKLINQDMETVFEIIFDGLTQAYISATLDCDMGRFTIADDGLSFEWLDTGTCANCFVRARSAIFSVLNVADWPKNVNKTLEIISYGEVRPDL